MKKLVTCGLAALLAVWAVGATAAPKKDAPPPTAPGKAAAKPAAAKPAGEASAHGPIKGEVKGKMFTVASPKGPTMVDASKATLRINGKFAAASALAPGTMVTAKGAMEGTTLKATSVDIFPRKSKK